MSTTPDPGKGWRLVTDYSEAPHPMAQIWLPGARQWHDRITPLNGWLDDAYYRVPIDPMPVPPIPTSEDPCPFFNEPDRSPAVVLWIIGALVFVTGFLFGWSL